MEDKDFVEAIQENYRVIPKMIEFNIQLLEELITVDPNNEFLKKNNVKDLYDQHKQILEEGKEFNKQFEKPETTEKIELKNEDEKILEIKKEEPEEIYL